MVANGKRRKKKIFQLEQNLKFYISEYYKKLFGAPAPNNFSLLEDLNQDIPQLTDEENSILMSNFSVNELNDAISQMETNKAPGLDGFPAEFYQKIWGVIKEDLMSMFFQLQQGNFPLFRLNFGVITLLPKKENAVQIQ